MSSPCTSTLRPTLAAMQLGLLRLRRRLLLRRCRRWRLRSRLLTTSADDSPANNGEDNDDGGCNSNHLISRHVLTSRLSLASLDEQSAKEKGRARGRPLHNPPKLARHCIGYSNRSPCVRLMT